MVSHQYKESQIEMINNNKYNGFFRAKVVNNNDPDEYGRVMVYIPDLMPEIPDNEGIWARPANNPIGGRNVENESDNHYMGSSYIPAKGSWIWIFFEKNNINRPYYFGALDLQNAKVLPENQLGGEPYNKWVIFKSSNGRTVVVSDDSDDARVEITGKKRAIKTPPSGDKDSVYTIDDNQTTILFDERDGKEKILIRTHKGDFFHIDVNEQKLQGFFKEGIELKSDGDIKITGKNMHLKATEKLNMQSTDDMNLNSGGNLNQSSIDDINLDAKQKLNVESVNKMNLKSGTTIAEEANAALSIKAGGVVAIDGSLINENGGISTSAESSGSADSAESADPKGERDT